MTRFWWVRHGPTHARVMIGLPLVLEGRAAVARFWWVRQGPTHARVMTGLPLVLKGALP